MRHLKYIELFSCADKVTLITGGCGLIGRELIAALKEFGALIYVLTPFMQVC